MNEENEEKTIEETKKAIEKAKKNLEEISNDEHERYLAHLREKHIRDQYAIEKHGYEKGMAEGMEKGIEKGIVEGKTEERKNIAKKLLKEKIDIKTIISATGLKEEEIKKIEEDQTAGD